MDYDCCPDSPETQTEDLVHRSGKRARRSADELGHE